jgi:putative Mn2+ efflux pump MntP
VLRMNIALAAGIIGVTSLLVSLLGFNIGRKVGEVIGQRAETIGGIVLIIIGLRILLSEFL